MKLILHIGGAKCGSSAIQKVLSENVDHLRSVGVLVPGANLDLDSPTLGQQIRWFLTMVDHSDGPGVVTRRLGRLRNRMSTEGLHTLIVSAENLINQARYADLFADADDIFDDVQIIAYVRRQDDYVVSSWQQWGLKQYPSLEAYLDRRLTKDANWSEMLEPWAHRFGAHRVMVRRFVRSKLSGGDVVEDFFTTMNLPGDSIRRNNRTYNPSFNEHAAELAHRVRDLFKDQDDQSVFRDLRYAIGPALLKNYSGSILLTLEQRRQIVAAYEDCNAALRSKYFADLPDDEPLFPPPTEADVVTVDELERLRAQQDVLTRAIVGLAQRIRGMEQSGN